MPTYAIGDIQGCNDALQRLLVHIQFDPRRDKLWFTGDLVNRGPNSLEVLRFIKSLGDQHQVVLGNHDLHLLALAYGAIHQHKHDTLAAILSAPDRDELITWLKDRPLLHHDEHSGYVMVHAGLAPTWTLDQAKLLAKEVEAVLQGPNYLFFLQNMYGNLPDRWDDALTGIDRLRCIVNYLTRLRFCHPDGRIDLSYKGEIASKPVDLLPWFLVPERNNAQEKIIFGHWAALGGNTTEPNIYPLDTGCVWGNCLTAFNLENEKRFTVKCKKNH